MTPTFCRLELLGPTGWYQSHGGINLLYPEKYPDRMARNGKIGRVIIVDTGEIITASSAPAPCSVCDEQHTPFAILGECLI